MRTVTSRATSVRSSIPASTPSRSKCSGPSARISSRRPTGWRPSVGSVVEVDFKRLDRLPTRDLVEVAIFEANRAQGLIDELRRDFERQEYQLAKEREYRRRLERELCEERDR